MKGLLLLVIACQIFGCAPREGIWTWVHSQGNGREDLWQAIEECEEYADIAEMDGNFEGLRKARPYGGWGNFPFEFCMHEKGWELEFLPAGLPTVR